MVKKLSRKFSPAKDQKKISSYFSSASGSSSLFTSIKDDAAKESNFNAMSKKSLVQTKKMLKTSPFKAASSSRSSEIKKNDPPRVEVSKGKGDSQGLSDDSFDSDLEIIENTPEAKLSNKRNVLDDDLILSPDFIPPTPQNRCVVDKPLSSTSLLLPHKFPLIQSKSSQSLLGSRSRSYRGVDLKPKPISRSKLLSKKLSSGKKLDKSVNNLSRPFENLENKNQEIIIRNEINESVEIEALGSRLTGKENVNKIAQSLKRSAVPGSGISPDPKRAIVHDRVQDEIDSKHCKSNLLKKFICDSPASESESDGSFSILQGSVMNKTNQQLREIVNKYNFDSKSEILDDSIEILVSTKHKEEEIEEMFDKDNVTCTGIMEVEDKKNTIEDIFGASQEFEVDTTLVTKQDSSQLSACKDGKDSKCEDENNVIGYSKDETDDCKTKETCDDKHVKNEKNIEVKSIDGKCLHENEKKMTVIPETEEFFDDDMSHMFDDELAMSFEKMSPFKDQKPVEKPTENKIIKRIVDEGLGDDSYAVNSSFGRHIVTYVDQDPYKGETFLQMTCLREKTNRTCSLRGFWCQSAITEGDVVHILSTDPINDHYTVDNSQGLIIINPDYLISGTSVVSAVFCRRKSVLNERFKGMDSGNQLMLIGSLVHQLFQEVVESKITSEERLSALVKHLLAQPKMLKEMYGLGISETTIIEEINQFLPRIHNWSRRYLGNSSMQSGSGKDRRNQWAGKIQQIQDIEENVWSPKFGIKGKIDLTVKTNNRGSIKVVPLELKTGKSSFSAEHRGQVTLYSMMSADRREDPQSGLLLYLRDGAMEEVPAGEKEKKGLIQLRNEIIHYLTSKPLPAEGSPDGLKPPKLPEPISFERACMNCAHLLTCTVYQKSIEETVPEASHPMATLIPQTTGHLTKSHLEYFRLWCLLLHLEIAINKRDGAIRALWCQDSAKRESSGDCLSFMVLDASADVEEKETGQFVHTFVRSPSSPNPMRLEAVGLQKTENVVVSSKTDIALTMGAITEFKDAAVCISLDRNLKKYPNWRSKIFSIDRIEYQNVMSINFTNVARLMMDSEKASTLRSLIIDKTIPCFKKGLSQDFISKGKTILKRLNKTQQRAVLRTLMAENYSLLKGFPGTGKTSTIVALVELMVALEHSVLVTSYTHSAVDNILLKLKSHNVDFLRLGRVSRIHPDLIPFADERLSNSFNDVAALTDFYSRKLVVATTCLGVNHVLFSKRTFDFCIVDEASQVLQAAALGPLFHAKRFVLVGDPQQLPPVIQSAQAKDLGMAESLFMRLDQEDLGATSCLTEQYRMNGQIMRLANEIMYDGQLKCASSDLEERVLELPNFQEIDSDITVPSWIKSVISCDISRSVVFLDTIGGAPEGKDCANRTINVKETSVVCRLIQILLKCGMNADDVGVITPYRAQVKNIRDSVLKVVEMGHRIEVNTVDQYQGRDKSVIIYACVRSGIFQCESGEILNDNRRLNVAVTRAKSKLIMIGDKATLQLFPPFKKLTSCLDSSQILALRENENGFSWSDFS